MRLYAAYRTLHREDAHVLREDLVIGRCRGNSGEEALIEHGPSQNQSPGDWWTPVVLANQLCTYCTRKPVVHLEKTKSKSRRQR